MKKFKNREEAFASQNFDPGAVVISGVPEQHVAAVKAFINLCVGHDAVNVGFSPDFTDGKWNKFSNYFKMGSPSGSAFSFNDYGRWSSISFVGSRLTSGSSEASEHIAELFRDDYKDMMVYDRKVE